MIENYGDVTALSILVGLMVWYFKYTTKRQATREDNQDKERAIKEEKHDKEQKEERDYYRKVIDGGMQKNAVLNTKSLSLQKRMMKDFRDHNGNSKEFSEKIIESLGKICDKLSIVGDRRKSDKKVNMERRK